MSKSKLSSLLSSSRAVALEPRLLFDGAGAVGAADAFDHDAEPEQQEAPEQSPEKHEPGSEAPQPLFMPMAINGLDDGDAELKDDLKGKEIKIEEDTAKNGTDLNTGFTVNGSEGNNNTVVITVDKGELTYNGQSTINLNNQSVQEIQSILDALGYKYTAGSEVGDKVTITITINDEVEERIINITPKNDAPTIIKPTDLDVDEGGTLEFGEVTTTDWGFTHDKLGITDPDNIADQVMIKITSIPDKADGKLTLDRNGITITLEEGSLFSAAELKNLKFVHSGKQVLDDNQKISFKYTINDGAGGISENNEVEIKLNPVNQTPTIEGGDIKIIQGEGPVAIGNNNGTLPVLGGGNIIRGEAIGSDAEGETLTYKITDLPKDSSGNIIGKLYHKGIEITVSDLDSLEITDLSKLTYEYPKDLEPKELGEEPIVIFKISVTDLGGGTDTPATSDPIDIVITVLDNNNDPVIDKNIEQNYQDLLDKDDSPVNNSSFYITTDMLNVIDPDSIDSNVVFTITSKVSENPGGYFTLNGQLLDEGTSFTLADIIPNEDGETNVKYHMRYPNNTGIEGEDRIDSFDFTVKDSGISIIFPDKGDAYQREGGIYESDTDGSNLKVHTFKVIVPPTVTEGGTDSDLPGLPPKSEQIEAPTINPLKDVLEGTGYIDGSNGVNITDAHLKIEDKVGETVITPADGIVYRIESLPDHGSIWLNGKELGQFDTFTQADLDNGNKVEYRHRGSENFSDNVVLSASNGTVTTASTFTLNIEITPQNDTPVAEQKSEINLKEGEQIIITSEHIELTDSDKENEGVEDGFANNNELWFVISELPNTVVQGDYIGEDEAPTIVGKLQWYDGTKWIDITEGNIGSFNDDGGKITLADLDGNKLRYFHNGSEDFSDSFKIIPWDNQEVVFDENNPTNLSSEGTKTTINISIVPVNDAPVLKSDSKVHLTGDQALYEGEEATIIGSDLSKKDGDKPYGQLVYADQDNNTVQNQYQIHVAPKYGTLYKDGVALSKGSAFSQQDLDNGLITYKHDGSENHSDSFEYTVSDGDYTVNDTGVIDSTNTEPSVFNIEIKPTNDTPEIKRTQGNAHIVVDSADNSTSLGSFTITDPDLDDPGVNPDEVTDHFRVTVEAVKKQGGGDANNLLEWVYDNSGQSVTIIETQDGSLIFEGKKADVQTFLNNLKVKIAENEDPNEKLTIKVTVDDRIYSGENEGKANGGDKNDINGTPTDIPGDKYAESNTDTIEIEVWASAVNDTPEINNIVDSVVVNEDGWDDDNKSYNENGRTKLNLAADVDEEIIKDDDAFDTTNNKLTLTIDVGEIYFSQDSEITDYGLPDGIKTSITINNDHNGGKGQIITLEGTKADIEKALKSIYYKSPQDFNGNAELTINYHDGNSVGKDNNDEDETPKPDVEKTVNIHILPVNDTPIIGSIKQEGGDEITPIPEIGDAPLGSYVTLNNSYEFSDAKGNAITFTDPDRNPNNGGGDTADYQNGQQYSDDGDDNIEYTVTIKANLEGADNGFGKITFKGGNLPDGINIINGKDGDDGELVIKGTYTALENALNAGIIYTPDTEGAEDKNILFSINVNDNSDGGTKLTDDDTGSAGLETDPETTKSFYFQLTDANDAPKFELEVDGPTFAAHDKVNDRKPVILDPDAKVSDEELNLFSDNGGSWKGAVLKLERGTGNGNETEANPSDKFEFTDNVTVSSNKISINGKHVADIINNNNGIGTLELEFTENAKSQDVNDLLKSITYKNTSTNINNEFEGEENAAIDIIYSMRDGNSNDIPTNPGDETKPGDGQNQGTGGQLTGYGKVTIGINRQVVAKPDEATVTEPNTTDKDSNNPNDGKVTGDLTPGNKVNEEDPEDLTNNDDTKVQDHDPDAGDTIKVVEVSQNGNIGDLDDDGTITIEGKYGTLVVQPDGKYEYTVDPENLVVQGLIPGEKLDDEVFDYKVIDREDEGTDNTSATSTLTITINGSNDPVKVEVEDPPTGNSKIDVDDPTKPSGDRTTADHIVFESGLDNDNHKGSSPNANAIKVESSFTIDALDGLEELKVGGKTISLSEDNKTLVANDIVGQTITTEYGEIKLTSYDKDEDGLITIEYEYTLNKTTEHSGNDDVFDEITIIATDRAGEQADTKDSDTQTLSIRIVNDAPIAEDDTYEVDEGATLTVDADNGVLSNDTKGADGWFKEGENIAAVIGVGVKDDPEIDLDNGIGTEIEGTYGTLILEADGSYTYVSKPNTVTVEEIEPKDVFTYKIRDADGDTAIATLTINIKDVTLESTSTEDSVNENGLIGGTKHGDNEHITNGQINLPNGQEAEPKTITSDYGTFEIDKDGNYTYTLNNKVPNPNEEPVIDTFTYIAKDINGNEVENTVTITIIDDGPKAQNDVINLGNKPSIDGNVILDDNGNGVDISGADGWPVDGNIIVGVKDGSDINNPANGGVGDDIPGQYGTLVLKADGSYTYTRNENAVDGNANDVFTYTITDSDGDTSTATITIEIGNKVPKIEVDGIPPQEVREAGLNGGSSSGDGSNKTTGTITYTPGDGDHTVTIKTPPSNGNVVIKNSIPNGDGTVTIEYEYTLNKSTDGDGTDDKFTITITDEDGDNIDAEVTINIVNDTPTAKPDTGNVVQGQTTTGNVTSNDKPGADGWNGNDKVTGITGGDVTQNPDNSWTVTTDKGTLTINPNGSYSYTANPDAGGDDVKDVFEYTITDKDGDTTTAELTINISDNTPPIAEDDYRESVQDRDITGSVIYNDSDPDGDPLTVTTITINGKTYNTPDVGAITVEIPNVGKFIINNKGTYGFIPVPGFTGNVPPIGYTITDGNGGTDKATLFIKYTPGNPEFMPPMPPMPIDPGSPYSGSTDPLGITGGKSIHSSSVTTDPSVFYDDERYDDVRRLPIPLHPILYVNNEVANSQELREQADQRISSDPDMIEPGETELVSQATGLGQDHNLFVSHTIRSSAQEAQGLSNQVTGRLSRTDLSADGMLGSGRLYDFGLNKFGRPDDTDEEATNDNSVDAENIENQDENANATNAQDEANNQIQDLSFLNSIDHDQTNGAQLESENTGSLSFTQQLRQHINRLPIAVNDKISA